MFYEMLTASELSRKILVACRTTSLVGIVIIRLLVAIDVALSKLPL